MTSPFSRRVAAWALAGGLAAAFASPAEAGNHGLPADWSTPPADCATEGDPRPACQPLDISGYRLVFHDEFDRLAASRDGGAGPWFAGIHADMGLGRLMGPGDPAYSVSGGVLTLATRQEGGAWKEANLQTADSHGRGFLLQNGYFEVRARPAQAKGAHSGVWLLGAETGRGHPEIDLIETYGAGDPFMHSSSHISGPNHRPHVYASTLTRLPGLYDGFHRFGLMATEEALVIYVDGVELKRIARLPEQRVPLYLLLSLFENSEKSVTEHEPAQLLVDYVRIYAPK